MATHPKEVHLLSRVAKGHFSGDKLNVVVMEAILEYEMRKL